MRDDPLVIGIEVMTEEKLSEPVMQAVRSGHTIRAVKQLRAETGLGLKEAKDIIDREITAYRRANPNAHMIQESSSWPKLIVAILIAAALYWYLAKGS